MIDTMLFAADIPADTYAAGDVVTLKQIYGPTVVRDGLGQPVLKAINTGALYNGSTSRPMIKYKVQNANWNDPIINSASSLNDPTGLSEGSTGYQPGNDCPLIVNSAFTVSAEWFQPQTTTIDNSVYIAIDIEYPAIAGVQDPRGEKGTPCSIEYDFDSLSVAALGNLETATWTENSFDSFKAGYRYLLQKMEVNSEVLATLFGFVKISGGASMGGLSRIVPITSLSSALGKVITYAPVEVKGPFTLGCMFFTTAAATGNTTVVMDYVKR